MIVQQHDVCTTLEAEIDRDAIPVQFGGDCHFKHGMSPQLADDILGSRSGCFDKLPLGPIKWTIQKDGEWTAVAVGFDGNDVRQNTVASLRAPEKH